jgi:hypothetical protein
VRVAGSRPSIARLAHSACRYAAGACEPGLGSMKTAIPSDPGLAGLLDSRADTTALTRFVTGQDLHVFVIGVYAIAFLAGGFAKHVEGFEEMDRFPSSWRCDAQ